MFDQASSTCFIGILPLPYDIRSMSPTWIWMQIAIVVFVVIGMAIAIVKLA